MAHANDWLTEAEMSELTGVPPMLLQLGAKAGLFDGLTKTVNGEQRYALDAASVIAWSDRLGNDVIAGLIAPAQARAMLWRRARQTRQRLTQRSASA
jgi:hypothetical protein